MGAADDIDTKEEKTSEVSGQDSKDGVPTYLGAVDEFGNIRDQDKADMARLGKKQEFKASPASAHTN